MRAKTGIPILYEELSSKIIGDYRKLVERKKGSIVDFFQSSPHQDLKLKFPRKKHFPRKIGL